LTRNPILKVLFTFRKHRVKSLLIGGQACIIYGAAEFSRDSDFVVLCHPANLIRLQLALKELRAENIYVPPLESKYLRKGHACHFRCLASTVKGLRIDIMARLRGCQGFAELWKRRYRLRLPSGTILDIIGLRDLVRSKKTQREKDWLMLSRLVENDIFLNPNPDQDRIRWWLLQGRVPDTLIGLAENYPRIARSCQRERPLLKAALKNDAGLISRMLAEEKAKEVDEDVRYWRPLRKELEELRHRRAMAL
jgi:hypothetical protein